MNSRYRTGRIACKGGRTFNRFTHFPRVHSHPSPLPHLHVRSRRLIRPRGPNTLGWRACPVPSKDTCKMTTETTAPLANEYFQVKRHGDVAVIVPSPEVEQLPDNLVQRAA